jgi:hypothetical protein
VKQPQLWRAEGGSVTHVLFKRQWYRKHGAIPPHWIFTWLCGNTTSGSRARKVAEGMPSCKGCRTRIYSHRKMLRRKLGLYTADAIRQMEAVLDAIEKIREENE